MLRSARQRAGHELADNLRKLRPEEAAVLALLQQRTRMEANGGLLRKQLSESLKLHRNGKSRHVKVNGAVRLPEGRSRQKSVAVRG